ncbi:sigma-70 family RNA polymerase sigma factor [Pararobbsia silviterrae]|uniref:sigma-70 family RNA polymerase sigma factor n=1 Tax=Pararobbsia silviterrae TaxID=1792498 RepID=UPI001F0CCE85|nr:sigma-70 family RNA polymerase sigma factor [Pararobbsia silviterrae]
MDKIEGTVAGALYVDHHSWLFGWLRKRTGNREQAADLAHDTFLRILLKSEPVSIDEPRSYLTVIAKGLLANQWRRHEIERAYLDRLATIPESFAPSPEDRALILESLLEIDAALSQLPDKARTTFLLAQLDHLGYAEIALKLGISLRTVKRYMVLAFEQCLLKLE